MTGLSSNYSAVSESSQTLVVGRTWSRQLIVGIDIVDEVVVLFE